MKTCFRDLEVNDVFVLKYKQMNPNIEKNFKIISQVNEINTTNGSAIKVTDIKCLADEDLDFEYEFAYDSIEFEFVEYLFTHETLLNRLEREKPEYFV